MTSFPVVSHFPSVCISTLFPGPTGLLMFRDDRLVLKGLDAGIGVTQ